MSTSITKKVLKNSFNYGIGTVLPKVIGFILIPVYTIYLTPADYGLVEICVTINSFLLVLFKMGIPGSMPRLYFDYKENFNEYLSSIFWFILILSISLLIITLVLGELLLSNINKS